MTHEEFFQNLPMKLNSQQYEAATTVDGPVLLLAVPGSGKTTVLVSRLGYMTYVREIQPEHILTITYTVAATKDMQQRFLHLFGPKFAERLEFRTINGICAKLILDYGRRIGKAPFELCSDEKRLTAILASIFQRVTEEFPTDSDLKGVRTQISYIKNMMLSEDEIQKLSEQSEVDIASIYKLYNQTLREMKLMDYDDQMVYALAILRSNPQMLTFYQEKYTYICVDEAQDTSKLQHVIIALLASRTQNLFMVGDEDQSIYGFRAAYPQALLAFEEEHPGAKVLLMEENYRSNANIVEAADLFIQKNTLRHEKNMRPSKGATSEVRVIELKSRVAQYSYLLKVAQDCQRQTAVLYRDNECALPLIDLLERQRIPYQIKNADLTFFSNRIVRDIRSIIAFAEDPFDTDLFLQIYYKMSTYLNKKKAEEACQMARSMDIPVLDAVIDYLDLNAHTVKSIRALRTNLVNMRKDTASKAMFRILDAIGYREFMDRNDLSESKVLILKALAANEMSAMGLCRRLDELQQIIREKQFEKDSDFILSTIHSSKGLEYDTVYLVDVFDSMFPEVVVSNVKKANPQDLSIYEEERRLFYVGATRAKENLYLFRWNMPASFISEFMREEKKSTKVPGTKRKLPGERKSVQEIYRGVSKEGVDIKSTSYRAFQSKLGEGVIVHHKKFGEGVVLELDGEKVSILFGEEKKTFYMQILYKLGAISFEE